MCIVTLYKYETFCNLFKIILLFMFLVVLCVNYFRMRCFELVWLLNCLISVFIWTRGLFYFPECHTYANTGTNNIKIQNMLLLIINIVASINSSPNLSLEILLKNYLIYLFVFYKNFVYTYNIELIKLFYCQRAMHII